MERSGAPTKERVTDRWTERPLPEQVVDRSDDVRGASRRWTVLRQRIVAGALLAVAAASLLSFFVKPRAPRLDLVSPAQELESFEPRLPSDHRLAERVVGSFGMAMVLVRNPYTAQNAAALEDVRSWAKERFHDAPDFLHPISVRPKKEPNDTLFGALGYNLFAGVHYALQGQVGSFVAARIADFHETDAYKSFQNAYFNLFGRDDESATLLARYQTERAKAAVDVVIWTGFWAVYSLVSTVVLVMAPKKRKFEFLRLGCSAAWFLSGVASASHAWMANSIPSMLSGAVAFFAALFFWQPFLLRTRSDASLKVAFYEPGSNWVALSVWLTFSLAAMLVLTWIRAGVPDYPDPVTLLLSALSGNFVQDPEEGKRTIARVIGTVWVGLSLWALVQKEADTRVEDELQSLDVVEHKRTRS